MYILTQHLNSMEYSTKAHKQNILSAMLIFCYLFRHIFTTKIMTTTRTPSCSNFGCKLSHRYGDSFTQCLSECPRDAEFVVCRFFNSHIQPSFTWLTDQVSKAVNFRSLRKKNLSIFTMFWMPYKIAWPAT